MLHITSSIVLKPVYTITFYDHIKHVKHILLEYTKSCKPALWPHVVLSGFTCIRLSSGTSSSGQIVTLPLHVVGTRAALNFIFHIYISYLKHIYIGYKFNKYIVLQFGPVKIKNLINYLQIN